VAKVVSVRIPDELYDILSRIMSISGESRSNILVEALSIGLLEILKHIEAKHTLDKIVDDMLRKNVSIRLESPVSIVEIVRRERE